VPHETNSHVPWSTLIAQGDDCSRVSGVDLNATIARDDIFRFHVTEKRMLKKPKQLLSEQEQC
jgi:hypothetical protein